MAANRLDTPDNSTAAPPTGAGRAATRPAIELRHLRYFLMVSEELHFRRAAERLYMAQPPLSQAIRRLEDELGTQLLVRTSRTVVLTEAGRVFAGETRKLLANLDLAVAETRRTGGGSPNLQVGCSPFLPIEVLLRLLDGLHERAPRVRTQIRHLVAFEQIRRLQQGELDLGIFPSTGAIPKLQTQPLFEGEQLAVFLAPDHPLAEKTALGPDDLANETLISPWQAANPPLAVWPIEQLERVGYRFRALHEAGADPRDSILEAAGGPGLALLPSSTGETVGAGTIVVRRPLNPPLTMPDTVVAWRAFPATQLRALTDEIRKLAHELRGTMSAGHVTGSDLAA